MKALRLLVSVTLALGAGSPAFGVELADEAGVRREGLAALPDLLPFVRAEDPGKRLQARRLIRLLVLDHYRSRSPEGMRLVPGRVTVTENGVQMADGYYLAVHEVTRAQFAAFAASAGMDAEPWSGGDDRLPATGVTFGEARAFAVWHGARLPTHDELERAATAGGRTRYPWGDRFDPRFCNSRENGKGVPEPAGARPSGRSAHGLADLLGNVAEWCDSSAGEGERLRILVVGGSFLSPANGARFVTYRLRPEVRKVDVGFRLAKSLAPLPPTSAPARG